MVNRFIGRENATGGTNTTGTLAAKSNELLVRLTAARAAHIGATGDTGGSAAAGTLSAKLNALLTLLSTAGTGARVGVSVQRGSSQGTATRIPNQVVQMFTASVTMSNVIVARSFALADSQGNDSISYGVFFNVNTVNGSMRVGLGGIGSGSANLNWQVISYL